MTQEEKARAYDEALEHAKEWKEKYSSIISSDGTMAKDFDSIFPQLAESEDERIRRKMIEHFKAKTKKTWCNMPVEDIIAYLEKQKEQKPADCIEDPVKFEEGFKAGRESGLRDGQKYVLNNLDSYGLCKPAEWSEEDEEMLEYVIGDLNDAKQLFSAKDAKDLCDKEIAWLKSLRPSWKPSKEQMKALQNAVALTACDKELARLYNQLKKL